MDPLGSKESPPVSSRLIAPDLVRGVALLGILYANVVSFGHPILAGVWPGAMPDATRPLDEAVWLSNFLVVDGRMRGLFSLLFGAGLVMFAQSRPASMQAVRLFWLAMFGVAHFFLLYRGDILFSYAVCGLLALPFVRAEARSLLASGTLLYVLGALVRGGAFWAEAVAEARFLSDCGHWRLCIEAAPGHYLSERYAELLMELETERSAMLGSFSEIVRYTAIHDGVGFLDGAIAALGETFPLFLLGMGLFKAGLPNGARPRTIILILAAVGIIASLALLGLLADWLVQSGHPFYLSLFVALVPAALSRLPMIVGLAIILAACAPRIARTPLGQRFVAAGRTALTNYLGCSLLMALLFHGWGLGLHGKLGRSELLLVVTLGWVAMLAWPQVWLARFRQGPMERLWHSLYSAR